MKMLRAVRPTPLQKSSQLDVQHVTRGFAERLTTSCGAVNGRVHRALEAVMRRFIIVRRGHFVEPGKLSLELA